MRLADKSQGTVSTLGWDTVFALHIDDLNRAISAQGSSPDSFEVADAQDDISATGSFGLWSVVPGGSQDIVKMQVPLENAILKVAGNERPPVRAVATIEFRLRFLDQDAGDTDGAQSVLHLTANPNAPSDQEPAVTITDLSCREGATPKSMDRIELKFLLETWLNANIGTFQHVFAVVNLNAAAAHDGFAWLQPTHVEYAYTDLAHGDGALAILCMTEGRSADGLVQQVVANVIPPGQRASFLLSNRRVLEKVFLPVLPSLFKDADASAFCIGEDGESITTTDDKVKFTVETSDGVKHKSDLGKFEFSLTDHDIAFGMATRTAVSPGIFECTRTENFLGLALAELNHGQTLVFTDTRPASVVHWTENDKGFTVAEIVLAAISLVGIAVATFATGGTALAATALAAGILAGLGAGGVALSPLIIDEIGTANAPTFDRFLLNTASNVKWTGGSLLRLKRVEICGAIRMSGNLDMQGKPT